MKIYKIYFSQKNANMKQTKLGQLRNRRTNKKTHTDGMRKTPRLPRRMDERSKRHTEIQNARKRSDYERDRSSNDKTTQMKKKKPAIFDRNRIKGKELKREIKDLKIRIKK